MTSKDEIYILEWPTQRPRPQPKRDAGNDPKIAESELNLVCEEEWFQNPPEHCAGVSSKTHLFAVIAAKRGFTHLFKFWSPLSFSTITLCVQRIHKRLYCVVLHFMTN